MPGGVEITPRDELTGQPLSLLVGPRDFHTEDKDGTAQFHHQQHPGNQEDLGRDEQGALLPTDDPRRIEGLAIRYSKGEMIPAWLHDLYHDLFYGPKQPEQAKEKHRSVLFGIAKVIPLEAIHIYEPGAWDRTTLSRSQHDFIRRVTLHENAGKTEAQNNRRGRIGSYLARYALQNFLPEMVDDREMSLNIEQFLALDKRLSKPREELRWDKKEAILQKGQPTVIQLLTRELSNVGETMVQQAIVASVEDHRPLYEEAIRAGMVQGTKRDLGQIAIKYWGQNRFPSYSESLKTHIAAAQDKTLRLNVEEVSSVPIAA